MKNKQKILKVYSEVKLLIFEIDTNLALFLKVDIMPIYFYNYVTFELYNDLEGGQGQICP